MLQESMAFQHRYAHLLPELHQELRRQTFLERTFKNRSNVHLKRKDWCSTCCFCLVPFFGKKGPTKFKFFWSNPDLTSGPRFNSLPQRGRSLHGQLSTVYPEHPKVHSYSNGKDLAAVPFVQDCPHVCCVKATCPSDWSYFIDIHFWDIRISVKFQRFWPFWFLNLFGRRGAKILISDSTNLLPEPSGSHLW